MKCLLLLALIVLACWSAKALTPGEITALEDLRTAWHNFARSPAPWSNGSLSDACLPANVDAYYGLRCSNDSEPHVTGLVIGRYETSGSLPASIGELLWLEQLYINNVYVEGSIPDVFERLTKLETFALIMHIQANFDPSDAPSPTIPPSIGNATSLKTFDFQPMALSGTIPASFAQLENLESFTLKCASTMNRLQISGQLPQGMARLESLRSIEIGSTNIVGLQPSRAPLTLHLESLVLFDNPYLALSASNISMRYMKTLSIDRCPRVSGALTLDVSGALDTLELRTDTIQAELSDEFWSNARNLTRLTLSGSGFRGFISPLIGQLASLSRLELAMPLVGSIPSELGLCKSLNAIFIDSSTLTGPLPDSIGSLFLVTFTIANAKNLGPIPSSYTKLSPFFFRIINAGLNGTLPLINAGTIDVSNNQLTGQLPSLNCFACHLAHNLFVGTVPCSVLEDAQALDLSFNKLGPNLSSECLAKRSTEVRLFDFSRNAFKCPLPALASPLKPLAYARIDASFNQFYGSIPDSWCNVEDLNLDDNHLSGELDSFFKNFTGSKLSLVNNDFVGMIPKIGAMKQLTKLHLDRNGLSGKIPRVNAALLEFTASGNKLNGIIPASFIDSVKTGSLTTLDLSNNRLNCENSPTSALSNMLASKTLKHLSLDHNQLECDFNPQVQIGIDAVEVSGAVSAAMSIDLSFNQLTGIFNPYAIFPTLVILDISHNNFTGDFHIPPAVYVALTQIDISSNFFTTDVRMIDALPFLFSLKASNNRLNGALQLLSMPKLETADLSFNELDEVVDLEAIGVLFTHYSLKVLSIKNNPQLPRLDMDAFHTGLRRSNFSSPSSVYPGVVCSSLTFYERESISFQFDEDLFDYFQCDCDTKHFGAPPQNCRPCPSIVDLDTGLGTGVDSCHGKKLQLLKNSWLVAQNAADVGGEDDSKFESAPVDLPDDSLHFESESCLVKPEQILMQQSNCLGVNMTAEDLKNASTLTDALQRQCVNGSYGRLCSSCICDYEPEDPSADPVCYYQKSLRCTKCSIVLTPRQYGPIIGVSVVIFVIVCTIIFLIALRNSRIQTTVPWHKLSLPKRLLHRVLYLVSLGNLSILITFVQIFIELTHWDAYAIGGIVKLINLNGSSLGITCIFPFLSNPTLELVTKTYVPLALLVVIVGCVGLAELFSRLLSRFARRDDHSPLDYDSSDALLNISSDADESFNLLSGASRTPSSLRKNWILEDDDLTEEYETLQVEYPTLALLVTVAITFTRFIYFSSALAAHEFLFSVFDRHTGVWYVQNYPSLRWADSSQARNASFPIIAIFDFVLPVGFLVLCFINRDKAKRTRHMKYYGSLFDNFSQRCYWWEMVIIFKKLSIALVLQGVPSSNVLQITLIVTIIGGIQLIQMSLQPWRRKIENIADSIASLILIGALLAARAGRYHNSTTSVYYVIAFAVSYVILSLVLIAWQVYNGKTDYQKRLSRLAADNPHLNDNGSSMKAMRDGGDLESESNSDFEASPLSLISAYSSTSSLKAIN